MQLTNFIRSINWPQALKRLLITVAAGFFTFFLLNRIFPLPDKIDYSVVVTDDRGEIIHAFLTHDQQWRMKTELNEISPLLRKTIIDKEDRHFYHHPGINPFSMARAVFNNLAHGRRTSGASTITMQVARALEPKKRTYLNKLVESFRALQLEWKYSKDEILQLYLNLAPYGSNVQGVKSAALLYFRKNPDHLSLAEITALSVIPNRPSTLVIGKNNDMIVRERNRWLKKFQAEGFFSEKEIRDALDEPLIASRGSIPRWLPQLSYRLRERTGELMIKTHINMVDQSKIETLVASYSQALALRNIRNAAVVVIDNRNHQVISYVGSADFKDSLDGGQVNGASAIRQPGSTLKPLLYGLCIDAGLLTPKMAISDVPVNFDGYTPENYDKKFNGDVAMDYALEHSLNIPAVKSLRLLGKDKLVDKLADCDFQQVKKDRPKLGLSLILGGCGATLEELTGLYSSFANDGVYVRPAYFQTDSLSPQKRMLSPSAAFMINETLSKIDRPDFPLNWQSTEHLPKIAWKTGTSYGRRDAWSIGYNKHYTVGVWTGNFSGLGVAELSGANIATPLLFRIFNTIDYDSDEEWFQQPADCQTRVVCSETGCLPSEHCTHFVSDYFIPLVSPAIPCNNMEELMVSANEKISYCKACAPSNGYKKKLYKVIAPDLQAWMRDNGIAWQHIPLHNPECERVFQEGGPVITSPSSGIEYLLSRKHPEPIQLSCRSTTDAGMLYWYVNNKFYKSCPPGSKQFLLPEEGLIKISCSDDRGRNKNVWITVKYADL